MASDAFIPTSKNNDDDDDVDDDNDNNDNEDADSNFQMTAVPSDWKNALAIHKWQPLLRRHTIKTRFITLSETDVKWINADGIRLPQQLMHTHITQLEMNEQNFINREEDERWNYEKHQKNENNAMIMEKKEPIANELTVEKSGILRTPHGYEENDDSKLESDVDDDDDAAIEQPDALIYGIERAIMELNDEVFPTMQWHSPSDAAWITAEKRLRCTNAADVLLLLKSSSRIAEDLAASEPVLALRKWSNLHPSSEFRAFIRNRCLLAICQRDMERYEHLDTDCRLRQELRDCIVEFYDEVIERNLPCESVVMDVYVDLARRVWLIDFKPWSTETDALLFSWKHLCDMPECELPLFRVVSSNSACYHRSLRAIGSKMMGRLPWADNIDVSDAAAIDRFVQNAALL